MLMNHGDVRFCAEPVREFAPPYKASDTEAAEQYFEPDSENRRFSEWVDPDGAQNPRKEKVPLLVV